MFIWRGGYSIDIMKLMSDSVFLSLCGPEHDVKLLKIS